jgi:hypothetical protein
MYGCCGKSLRSIYAVRGGAHDDSEIAMVGVRRAALGALVGLMAAAIGVVPGASGAGATSNGPAVWVLGGMTRVLPTAPAQTLVDAGLSAARGETVPFQVAVTAGGVQVTGATLTLSDLLGPGAAQIPATDLVRYREHFIHISAHSPTNGDPILKTAWFPDALIPFIDPVTGRPPASATYHASPFDVPLGHTQPLWVDVTVPRDAVAGAYTGRWTVTSDQGSQSGQVLLQVRNFTLPLHPAAQSSFGVKQPADRSADVNALLLRYGVQPTPVDTRQEPSLAAQGMESNNLGFWSGADRLHCTMSSPPSVDVLRAAVATHLDTLQLHNDTADEISQCPNLYPKVRAWARRLHAVGVDQKVTIPPVKQLLYDGAGGLGVDIFSLLPLQFQTLDARMRKAVLQRGGQFWSYQALVQGTHTPSWELDFPGANYRILPGFLNARMGVRGVQYWAVDNWQHNPWRNIDFNISSSGPSYPGEGTLVYPGGPAGVVGVVPSIRLAWIRQGIDDFGYVQLLRNLGQGALANRIIDPAAHSWTQWTRNPQVLADVRNQLAAAIEHYQGSASGG